MPDLQIFEHPEFGRIRVLEIDGEPWFVAADVCRALEHTNTAVALDRLDDDEKGVSSIYTPGGNQQMSIVNEPGLYSLVLGSRKPEAKAFKRWITHEVLPSIRKTGSYSLISISPRVEQRALTTDDYLKAAVIVANCRNERLPYVLGFLEKGGWEIPRVKDTPADRIPIAVVISKVLEETGLSIQEIERRTGISRFAISRYKNGQRNPRPETYEYIVRRLDTLTTQTE